MTGSSHCSPARPWGIHLGLPGNLCPRCGWVAREPSAPDGDPPSVRSNPASTPSA